MTDVLVDLAVRAPGGGTAPAKGTVYASPTIRARDGSHVVLATGYRQVLVAGVTTFTGLIGGVWQFREEIPAGGGIVRTVTVPAGTAVVNYGDLANV